MIIVTYIFNVHIVISLCDCERLNIFSIFTIMAINIIIVMEHQDIRKSRIFLIVTTKTLSFDFHSSQASVCMDGCCCCCNLSYLALHKYSTVRFPIFAMRDLELEYDVLLERYEVNALQKVTEATTNQCYSKYLLINSVYSLLHTTVRLLCKYIYIL